MLAQQYKSDVRSASILPALDVSSVAWFVNPAGDTHTGQIESLELIDGDWWAACRYQLTEKSWVVEHRHAHNFFAGVGPEFPLQMGQKVFFKRGNVVQPAKIDDFYLESGEWFAALKFDMWYGTTNDERPLCEIFTSEPEREPEPEDYSVWCDDRNDIAYEDRRDSR